MKKKEEGGSKKIVYVKVKSINDFARLASGSDFESRSVIAISEKGAKKLVLLGESISNKVIAYCCDSEGMHKGFLYSGTDSGSAEKVEFYDKDPGMEKGFIDIFDVELKAFGKGSISNKDVSLVKVGSGSGLVKMAIRAAVKEETIKHLYSFTSKGKRIIGGFDLIEELNDDVRNFYYAFGEEQNGAAFARYDYKSGRVEFTDRVGEYSYMYLKIINLAEPFPFFKMPD